MKKISNYFMNLVREYGKLLEAQDRSVRFR